MLGISTPLVHSRKSIKRRPSARPRRAQWLTAARPIRCERPAHTRLSRPVIFAESADVGDGFSRATPTGYKTPDNKVLIVVEVVNNRVPWGTWSAVFCTECVLENMKRARVAVFSFFITVKYKPAIKAFIALLQNTFLVTSHLNWNPSAVSWPKIVA